MRVKDDTTTPGLSIGFEKPSKSEIKQSQSDHDELQEFKESAENLTSDFGVTKDNMNMTKEDRQSFGDTVKVGNDTQDIDMEKTEEIKIKIVNLNDNLDTLRSRTNSHIGLITDNKNSYKMSPIKTKIDVKK